MTRIDTLFVDKGGVLIDNADDLGPQWRRLIGEFLSQRLGGSPRSWGEANVPAFVRQMAEYYRAILSDSGADPVRAVVVDDSPNALSWAGERGLRGYPVERHDGESFDDAVTRAFDEVTRAIN